MGKGRTFTGINGHGQVILPVRVKSVFKKTLDASTWTG